MADRVGCKYILIGGLVLFATGMGYVDWIAEVNSGRWSFLPGLIVAGVGLGFTWTPLYNIAMRDVQPRVTRIWMALGRGPGMALSLGRTRPGAVCRLHRAYLRG
jgi:hypothetical protein